MLQKRICRSDESTKQKAKFCAKCTNKTREKACKTAENAIFHKKERGWKRSKSGRNGLDKGDHF